MNRNVMVSLAMATALAARGAGAAQALSEAPVPVVIEGVRGSAQPIVTRDATSELDARVTPKEGAVKPQVAAIPDSSGFTLLGLGVVLVGVIARQRRRFSRSGTILLR